MSLLRRVVVVSKKLSVQDRAREIAREVFVADDLEEARGIVTTVAPDMIAFDDTLAPVQIQEYLAHCGDMPAPRATVVVAGGAGRYAESEYQQTGLFQGVVREEDHAQWQDLATRICESMERREETRTGGADYFLDETAAAVGLVGRSRAIAHTLQVIKLVAASQCNPVLIVGDTGTGKEVAARAVHRLRHSQEPFVAVNCAALTATLLESELFGHVKGSFTGADRDKTGLLELASTGTIFLDEISEMPLELQAKLLRLLQEKTFRKVGGTRDLACQATILASSNRDLKKEVREKRFRQDLFYRLNICPVTLAPLHAPERREDIALLADYFLKTSNICAGKRDTITAITRLALEALARHDWPGNVRELRNTMERAILLETTDKIGLSSIVIDPIESSVSSAPGGQAKDFSLEKAERELIARALHETGWQKTQAAALLGITRATLYAKVKQYNLRREGAGAGASLPLPAPFAEAATAAAV